MTIQIDEMIDMIAETIPDFIDMTKTNDRDIYSIIRYLIIYSKVLAQRNILCKADIDCFTEDFFKRVSDLMDKSRNVSQANLSYNYIKDHYEELMDYLEELEEYEMCSNFKSFFIEFNDKTRRINELEE